MSESPAMPPIRERSEWAAIQEEVGQAGAIRQRLIKELESVLEGWTVLTYFTSFAREQAIITDSDAEMFEEVLMSLPERRPVCLIIDSPGGDALAAERIVNVCRVYSNDEFEVIVPHMAKSAATLIAFGANRIRMSPTSELGPVDPQVPIYDDQGNRRWISADEFLRAYDSLMQSASRDSEVLRIEPYLQQLHRFDARYVEQVRTAKKVSNALSVELLCLHQMKGQKEADIARKICPFTEQEHKGMHGRRIGADEARDCGLNVSDIDVQSEEWSLVWKIFRRSSFMVGSDGPIKIMESAHDSWLV